MDFEKYICIDHLLILNTTHKYIEKLVFFTDTKLCYLIMCNEPCYQRTLICFRWPVKVDKDWDRDCSSPMSANTESNHGIFTGSEDNTYIPVIIKKINKKIQKSYSIE